MRALRLIAIILFVGCSSEDNRLTDKNIHLHKLTKLYVTGDFDGDSKEDTIYQHNFSKLFNTEIDSSADPFYNAWDTVAKWFYNQQSDVYLTINKSNQDSLHLGTAQGLYCLLNIGDNNSDGKDEIAFVVDYCDFSNLNSCNIYSFCNNKWANLLQFDIHEDAFIFSSGTTPTFKNIKGYLERQDKHWIFKDYNKQGESQMKQLRLTKCR